MRQNIEKIAKNCEKWNQDPPINPPTPLLKIVWRFIPPSNSPPYFALGGLTSTSSTAKAALSVIRRGSVAAGRRVEWDCQATYPLNTG